MASVKEEIKRNLKKSNKINNEHEFKSTHSIAFEVAPHFMPDFLYFRVGTIDGIYCWSEKSYMILAITNEKKGNGHLQDVFDWFENSCKRDKKNLMVLEVWNKRFKKHLIKKRGFVPCDKDHVIKFLKDIK